MRKRVSFRANTEQLSLSLTGASALAVLLASLREAESKVKGTYEGKTITVDFTPKGGPKDVTATYAIGKGLTFPDGNTWAKI